MQSGFLGAVLTGVTGQKLFGDYPIAGDGFGTVNNVSDGIDTTINSRLPFVSSCDAIDPRTTWGNFLSTFPQSIRCAIEYPADTFTPMFFGGSRDITLQPGSVAQTDAAPLWIPPGEIFWVRSRVTVTLGDTWHETHISQPFYGFDFGTRLSGGIIKSADNQDLTTSGTIPDSYGWAMGPEIISGHRRNGAVPVVVGVSGDGITVGATSGGSPPLCVNTGPFVNKLYTAGLPWVVAANPASLGEDLGEAVGEWQNSRIFTLMRANATHFIDSRGSVIIGNGDIAFLQAFYQNIWALYGGAGLKIWQCTIPPVTTSSDGWTTTANQTVTVNESKRVALNDWFRSVPSGLSGFIEVADILETSRNSGKWKVTPSPLTLDGIHPSSAGWTAYMAGLVMPTFS